MEPVVIAAKFAAYTSHCHGKPDSADLRREARRFAQTNWLRFLGDANEGLGRLLLRVAKQRRRARFNRPSHSLELATA